MKKILITCLLFSLLLCGCANQNQGEDPQTTTPSDTSDVFDQIALDAAEARAEYYQNLVVELQKDDFLNSISYYISILLASAQSQCSTGDNSISYPTYSIKHTVCEFFSQFMRKNSASARILPAEAFVRLNAKLNFVGFFIPAPRNHSGQSGVGRIRGSFP